MGVPLPHPSHLPAVHRGCRSLAQRPVSMLPLHSESSRSNGAAKFLVPGPEPTSRLTSPVGSIPPSSAPSQLSRDRSHRGQRISLRPCTPMHVRYWACSRDHRSVTWFCYRRYLIYNVCVFSSEHIMLITSTMPLHI